MKKFINKSLIFIIGTLMICSGTAYFFFWTTTGGSLVISRVIANLSKAGKIEFRKVKGSIIGKITLEDIRIEGARGLPRDSVVSIARADAWFTKFAKESLRIEFSGGALVLPGSEPINFSGELDKSMLNLSIHASLVNLQYLSGLFPGAPVPQTISGNLTDLKIKVSGSLKEPEINSVFFFDNVVYENYTIEKGSCAVTASARILKNKTLTQALIVIENMKIGLNNIPESGINIQKTVVEFNTRDISLLSVKVNNGRLTLPAAELILFQGEYINRQFNLNIYSKRISIDSLTLLFARNKSLVPVKGNLADIDLYLKGSMQALVLRGAGLVEKLNYGGFSLIEAPFISDLILKDFAGDVQVNGAVIAKKGKISGLGTAIIRLDESKLIFSGDPGKPGFDIKGDSTVAKTKIMISLKGMTDNPDLKLFSYPSLPQEQLLAMLITGKEWQGIKTVFSNGALSSDLVIDSIDYFVLGGSGSKIADKFGITGFALTLDKTKKGIELKKSVSDKVEVGYGVVQAQSKEKTEEITQKLSGELKVTDTVSVSAEKELKQANRQEKLSAEQKTNDNVMIRFKKNF